MKKILVCEDELSIRSFVVFNLQRAGYTVVEAGSGEEALARYAADADIMMALLDVMLPGIDGVELLKRMKASEELQNIPVIMATAKGTEYDKIQSLDLGADDYLVKPFGIMEMVSRVKAVLRRCKRTQSTKLLSIEGLVLNPSEHTVSIDGERVILTYKEYELLHLFLSQPGIAFTREQLLSSVWNTEYAGETRTVDMHIRTLRQKLGTYGHLIETVRNVGYRLEVKHGK